MILTQQLDFMVRKPRIFIVEGADCTGKTTLAKWLANSLNAAYIHQGWDSTISGGMAFLMTETVLNAQVMLQCAGLDVVLDRHWPSERCYAAVLRPGSPSVSPHIIEKLRQLDVVYIFCFRKDAVQHHANKKDSKHAYSDKQYEDIYTHYQELYNVMLRSPGEFKVIAYDMEVNGASKEEFEQFLNALINHT